MSQQSHTYRRDLLPYVEPQPLPDGFPVARIRDGGVYIVRNPAGEPAGTYLVEAFNTTVNGTHGIIRRVSNLSSLEVYTESAAGGAVNVFDFGLPPGGATGQFLRKSSNDNGAVEWATASGAGDMLASVYDPTNKATDAFSMDNMVEGTDTKILTAAERTIIANAVEMADLGDLAVLGLVSVAYIDASGTPDNTTFLRGDGTWAVPPGSGGGGGDMLAAIYDPNEIGADAFHMDNMVEGTLTKILTADERTKLGGIEAGADVTDATNVAAAGAVMDADFSADGFMVRTGAGAYASRTLQQGAGIALTNGDGVAGDPSLALDSATLASLALADTAVQPGDLGDLASADFIEIGDINATGTPDATTYLRGDGAWATPSGAAGVTIRPEDYGATGDGSTDDTTAMQAAFDAMRTAGEGAAIELTPGAIYSITNINVESDVNTWVRNRVFCPGTATIKRRSGGDTDYMVATARWLTSHTDKNFAAGPCDWENIIFDANGLCDYAVVNKSYGSEFHGCRFSNALVDGCLFTRMNQDGSAGTTAYLSGTKFIRCDGEGNAGWWLRTEGSSNTDGPTDGHVVECQVNCAGGDGCIYLANAGGWTLRGNHTFAFGGAAASVAEVWIRAMGNSGPIANNVFEGYVTIAEIGGEGTAMIGPGNNFWAGLWVDFKNDTSEEVLAVIGNLFSHNISGTPAFITHDNNRAQKTIISDNIFESTDPHQYGSGVTLGAYEIKNVVMGDASGSGAATKVSFNRTLSQYLLYNTNLGVFKPSGFVEIKATSNANDAYLAVDANNAYVGSYDPIGVEIQQNGTAKIKLTNTGHITLIGISNFADDTAAASGGVPVGGLYRTASALKIRVA